MRTWEAALAAFTIAIILSRMAGLHGRFFALAAAAGIAALTAVHAAVEGWRWQMYPLYGAAALALIAALAGSYARPLRLPARIAAGFPVTALACCGAAAAVLLPVFRVPPPAGPYAVGTMLFQAVDDNREEFFTESPDDKREIAIQVWYPAAPETQGPGAPWLERPDLYGAVLSAQVGMPTFFFDHVVHVRTNAVEGAPVAEGDPFPVVIYSHGWTAWRGINTDQVENLASHGYVVIVPEHAYGANLSILPDGRPIYNLPSIVPDRKDVGDEAYFTSIRRLVDAYAGDIRFCLDKAAEWHGAGAATPFGGKLDLDRIGVFGHSTGGGAVAEVMAEDPRIKAACAMDLWALPVSDDLLEAPKDTPFLGLESAVWSSEENTARIDRFLESLNGPAWYGVVAGTRHNDFTVVPLTTPIAGRLGLKGPLEGARVSEIVNGCLLAFFHHALNAGPTDALKSGLYPEIAWRSFAAGDLDVEGGAIGSENLSPTDSERGSGGVVVR